MEGTLQALLYYEFSIRKTDPWQRTWEHRKRIIIEVDLGHEYRENVWGHTPLRLPGRAHRSLDIENNRSLGLLVCTTMFWYFEMMTHEVYNKIWGEMSNEQWLTEVLKSKDKRLLFISLYYIPFSCDILRGLGLRHLWIPNLKIHKPFI